tara:strand:+ start:482 stop:631 length:150 start_codon:yes stop_codon:yes gene_type:complete
MSNDKKSQLDRFKEAARELETDDDEVKFNEKLSKLVKPKPDEKESTDGK